MRSGTIELQSGRWHWTLLPQWTGATVVFQHRDRVHDEMRSWTAEKELTQSEARELAVDAIERVWADMDGLKWRISIELPSDWRRRENGRSEASERSNWLVFKRGGLKQAVALSEDTHLGDLSHSQLSDLLKQSAPSRSDFLR